jgi:hypothetical protein
MVTRLSFLREILTLPWMAVVPVSGGCSAPLVLLFFDVAIQLPSEIQLGESALQRSVDKGM